MFIYCGHSVLDTGLKKKRFHSVLVNVHVRKPTGPNRERMNMRTDAQECELSQWQVWKAHPILSFKFIPAFERLDVVSELSPSSYPCLCLFFFRLLIPFTCPVLHHHLSTFSISTSSSHIAVSSHMSCLVDTFNPRSLRTPWLCTLLACFFFFTFPKKQMSGKTRAIHTSSSEWLLYLAEIWSSREIISCLVLSELSSCQKRVFSSHCCQSTCW